MGLFSRQKDVVKEPEQRSLEQDYGYSYPLSLSLLKNLTNSQPISYSAVFSAVELISNSIAQIPIHIRNKELGEIENHSLDLVFNGGLMTKFMLIKSLVSDCLIHGNGIAYLHRASDGTVTEIVYVPYNQVTIDYNEISRKLYYRIPSISKGKIEPVNVIHLVKTSKNGVVGEGIDKFALSTLKLVGAAENAAQDYYAAGGAVSGILKSTRPLTEQQKLDIKMAWSNAMTTGGNSIAVLGNDLDYTAVGANASDSQLLETRQYNLTEIARYFNVSPQLLGDLSHSTYNSIEQAQLELITHTLSPFISLIEDEFNRKLLKPSERNRFIIDFDENHLMKADKAATANYYSTLVSRGIMTINEARHDLGLTAKDGADELIIPFTDIDANTIGGNNEDKNTEE